MKKILLDTNTYTALLQGEKVVLSCLARAEAVFISVIVLGELYAGFRGGKKYEANCERLENFLSKPTVSILEVTRETSEIFGELKARLKGTGTPLPINDVWIASQTIETGAMLITFDAHFKKIDGLRVWNKIP